MVLLVLVQSGFDGPGSGCTSDFLNKKHVNLGQGLDFLKLAREIEA